MMDVRSFFSQLLTTGTAACTVFCAVIGFVFAILCLSIGVGKTLIIALFCGIGAFIGGVKDKRAVFMRIKHFFSDDGGDMAE
ncbi:MAG: DUF2273 domain-containing protein [Clostridia bacterium]|nr:DUF2273 domain-containing protein [Clostridia bacterium]